jgi:hypothetical protein
LRKLRQRELVNFGLRSPTADLHARLRSDSVRFLGFQKGAKVFEQAEQMVRIGRCKDKVKALIESSSVVVLRMNGKGSDASDISSLKRAEHRIFEKAGAHTLAKP